jgi:hypothetical protein
MSTSRGFLKGFFDGRVLGFDGEGLRYVLIGCGILAIPFGIGYRLLFSPSDYAFGGMRWIQIAVGGLLLSLVLFVVSVSAAIPIRYLGRLSHS